MLMPAKIFSLLLLGLVFLSGSPLFAEEEAPEKSPKALKVLKSMSDYLAALESFSLQTHGMTDASVALEGAGGQHVKLQYTSTRKVVVVRPDSFRVETEGDIAQRTMWSNGKEMTLYDHQNAQYSTQSVQGSISNTLKHHKEKLGMSLPLGNLLFSDQSEGALKDADLALYLGEHSVDRTPCHHLAFLAKEGYMVQLWVQVGEKPLPLKFVISNSKDPASPQHLVLLNDWKLNVDFDAGTFVPKVPSSAKKTDKLSPVFWFPVPIKK